MDVVNIPHFLIVNIDLYLVPIPFSKRELPETHSAELKSFSYRELLPICRSLIYK